MLHLIIIFIVLTISIVLHQLYILQKSLDNIYSNPSKAQDNIIYPNGYYKWRVQKMLDKVVLPFMLYKYNKGYYDDTKITLIIRLAECYNNQTDVYKSHQEFLEFEFMCAVDAVKCGSCDWAKYIEFRRIFTVLGQLSNCKK